MIRDALVEGTERDAFDKGSRVRSADLTGKHDAKIVRDPQAAKAPRESYVWKT